jgi:uncharacterized protein involved in exopolysaccharide biosynthesis
MSGSATQNLSPTVLVTEPDGLGLMDVVGVVRRHWLALSGLPLLAGAAAFGIASLLPPVYTASTSFLPPQQAQSAVASALSSLGPLASLAGGSGSARNPGDQYVALMQSATVSNRLVEQFDLMTVYKAELKTDARRELESRVRMTVGKKDGLLVLEVDDNDPKRAAAIANRYVDELRLMTARLDVTEAQQRRTFFAKQLERARDGLTKAQQALQTSGFNPHTLRAEPKAAADVYAKLRAEVTATEIRLQALRQTLADNTPEVRRELATLGTLRGQLQVAERPSDANGPDYIGRYREFRYQETLFELFARQYELARVDEAKEGTLIQVIDPATPPERKSKPKRATIAIGATVGVFLLVFTWLLARRAWHGAPLPAPTAT